MFLTLMLLFSSGYSMDMTSCRKIGEMNNNINNLPLYSMGVYMCLELPGHENSVPNTNSLDFSETRNNNIKNLSNTTILNSQNITKLVQPIYNSSNTTINFNISNSSLTYSSVPTTPSLTTPSTTTPSATTPPPTTTSSPTTTPAPTTTPSPITTTPVPTTTLSPSTNKPPDPTTNSPTPSPVTRQEPIIPTKNQPPNINNTQNSETFHNNPPLNIKLEDNPLLPIVIILISILVLAFCGVCCKYLYNKRKLKKISCNKSDKKEEEPDIESGEKKNRNSWTFSHKNVAQKKLRAMEQFKKAGNRATKKKALKPKLARTQEQQKSTPNRAPPNPKVAANKLRTLNNKHKKNVRDTLLEQSKTIPHGTNNPTLQKMLNRLEPHDEEENGKKWYKETFQAELDNLDVINNRPLTPPPPLPVPTFNQQSQPPVRKVYGNSQNKNSPKMIVREIVNPESPSEN